MEQLNLTVTRDNEKVYQILNNLMSGDKEFQIMITVPSGRQEGSQERAGETVRETGIHDLEKDVTNMIHEIGVPAHIKGYQYLREAIMMSVEDVVKAGKIRCIVHIQVNRPGHTVISLHIRVQVLLIIPSLEHRIVNPCIRYSYPGNDIFINLPQRLKINR